jgi:hypothetical protein
MSNWADNCLFPVSGAQHRTFGKSNSNPSKFDRMFSEGEFLFRKILITCGGFKMFNLPCERILFVCSVGACWGSFHHSALSGTKFEVKIHSVNNTSVGKENALILLAMGMANHF